MWNVEVTFDAAHRAVLAAGKPLVYVCPPAGWALIPLIQQLGEPGEGLHTVIIAPNPGDVLDVAEALGPIAGGYVHAATGLERTQRLLRTGAITTLVTTPAIAETLTGKSILPAATVRRTVCAWPERMTETAGLVDTVFAETRGAQRIIVTADEPAASDIVQRHARRAPVAVHSRPPDQPVVSARYAIVGSVARDVAVRAIIESMDPERTIVWSPAPIAALAGQPGVLDPDADPGDPGAGTLCVFADLPTPDLLGRAPAGAETVVLARPSQTAYLRRLTRLGSPVRISREPDRIRERSAMMRKRLRTTLDQDDLSAELQAIEPLLDEYDPALIAAAAVASLNVAGGPETTASTWTKMHLSAGRKDRVGPKDVVGALINAVGLVPDDIGRIDVQDRFTLVDVRPEDAPRVAQALTGQNLRGKRITARLDRR